jgi:hypothetical protein
LLSTGTGASVWAAEGLEEVPGEAVVAVPPGLVDEAVEVGGLLVVLEPEPPHAVRLARATSATVAACDRRDVSICGINMSPTIDA